MPRANRHYIPGYVWHITHRCHKKEFLLKFGRDRRLWIKWLFEAKKRHGLSILNYIVTSNHAHLLVSDNGERDTIPKSIQLIAGRTGQEYNQRKSRKGAFWEDRYHATAVAFDEHLFKCMYHRLIPLLQMRDIEELQESCRKRVEEDLATRNQSRDSKWTESIAVGSKVFIEATIKRLGIRAKGRKIVGSKKSYELREPAIPYGANLTPENGLLRLQNTYNWDDIG